MTEETQPKRHSRYDRKKLVLAIISGVLIALLVTPLLIPEPLTLNKVTETPIFAQGEPESYVGSNAAVEDALIDIDERLSAIEQHPQDDFSALTLRLDEMEERIAALESGETGGAPTNQLEGEMQRLRQEMSLFQLRQRLRAGESYTDLMPELTQRAAPRQSRWLATLQEHAGREPVTLQDLQQQFAQARQRAQAAEIPQGWWDRVLHQLRQSVTIRRVGEQQYDPEQPIDRAALLLDKGQLPPAIEVVRGLPEPKRRYFDEWSANAVSYLHQQRAVEGFAASLHQAEPPATPDERIPADRSEPFSPPPSTFEPATEFSAPPADQDNLP